MTHALTQPAESSLWLPPGRTMKFSHSYGVLTAMLISVACSICAPVLAVEGKSTLVIVTFKGNHRIAGELISRDEKTISLKQDQIVQTILVEQILDVKPAAEEMASLRAKLRGDDIAGRLDLVTLLISLKATDEAKKEIETLAALANEKWEYRDFARLAGMVQAIHGALTKAWGLDVKSLQQRVRKQPGPEPKFEQIVRAVAVRDADARWKAEDAVLITFGLPDFDRALNRETGLRYYAIAGCIIGATEDLYARHHNQHILALIKENGSPPNSRLPQMDEIENPAESFKKHQARGVVTLKADGKFVEGPDKQSFALLPDGRFAVREGDKTTFAYLRWYGPKLAGVEMVRGDEGSGLVFIHGTVAPGKAASTLYATLGQREKMMLRTQDTSKREKNN